MTPSTPATPGVTVTGIIMTPGKYGAPAFLAATTDGMYRSDDNGRTWRRTHRAFALPPATCVAASAAGANEGTVWAGTDEGAFCSRDGGQTWLPRLTGSAALAIAIVPSEGAVEAVFVGTERDGVLVSRDGGTRWTSANPGLLDLTVTALEFSPRFSTDERGFLGTPSGLYWTRNGGKSWRELTGIAEDVAVQCIACSPYFATDGVVLACTEADGLLRSTDAGRNWSHEPALGAYSVFAVTYAPNGDNPSTIAASTDRGIWVTDDGARWKQGGSLPDVALCLHHVHTPLGPVLLAGLLDYGIWSSCDAGTTWHAASMTNSARPCIPD